jgi:hypothetical protein
MRGAFSIAYAVLISGCAAFAGKSDYRDYRAVRLAHDDEQRLVAMQRYVDAHPDGQWHDALQLERQRREREIFEAHKSDRKGLELYLAAFPDGIFADQARSRLSAIAVIEQRKRDEAARAEQLREQRKQRDAELSRTWLTRFLGYWAKTLLAIDDWGAPIEQVAQHNPEFSRAFGRPPRPRCTSDECVKYYESSYAVPVPGGTRIEREVRLMLRLRLASGRLTRAELLIPQRGFSRWAEIEERQPIVDGDVEARQRALDFALGRLTPLLDELAPNRQPLPSYVHSPPGSPRIGPTGELVDTTAADPGAPSNRIQGNTQPKQKDPTISELVAPAQPGQTPDMVMNPLYVGPDGRPLTPPPATATEPDAAPSAKPNDGQGSPVMELAPIVIPRAPGDAPAAAGQPAKGAPEAPPETSALRHPGLTRAFSASGLRVVVFAAPSDAPDPAYDGLIIERAGPAEARKPVPTQKQAAPSSP